MSRARNIKPGFFKNEDLAECSPWARLCFAGLWTLADREGRLEDRPRRIKGYLFAFDSIEVDPLLDELVTHGFVQRYCVEGQRFIQILAFGKHQNPHHKEQPSVIPAPESPGLCAHGTTNKPEALTKSYGTKAQGRPEASPGFEGDERAKQAPETVLIPSSLIPSSLIPSKEIPPTTCPPQRQKAVEDRSMTAQDLEAEGVDAAVARDWIRVRKAKKAPLTATAWAGVKREAELAGITSAEAVRHATEGGWQGFKAAWLKRDGTKTGHEPMSFAERATEAKAQRIAELTGGMANATLRTAKKEIVDVDATEIHARRLA